MFKDELKAAMLTLMKQEKRRGTVSMGFECFMQNLLGAVSKMQNAPRGTNCRYVLYNVAREVIASDKNLKNFIDV